VASYLRSFWATGARDSRALPGWGGIRGGIGGYRQTHRTENVAQRWPQRPNGPAITGPLGLAA